MPTYLRIRPPAGQSESDISGAVSAHGYEGWIALESMSLTLERADYNAGEDRAARTASGGSGADVTQRAADAAQAPTTSTQVPSSAARSSASASQVPTSVSAFGAGATSQRPTGTATQSDSAATQRLAAASRMVDSSTGAQDVPATLRPVVLHKRLVPASARLFRWAARDTRRAEGTEYEARDLEIHVVQASMDGTARPAPVLLYTLRGCVPESYDMDTQDGNELPLERLVIRPAHVLLEFRETDESGRRGERREAEFDAGRAESR